MKTPIKLFLFLSLLASIPLQAANERDTLPENLLGNWINTSNQEWEYGFFENFAIYRSDFWDYKTIEKRGKNIRIVLEKGGQEVDLSIRKKEGKPLSITANGEEGQEYASFLKGFIPYQLPDTLRFEEPNITMDSVTILGYYRNLDHVKPEFKNNWGKYEAELAYDDLLHRGVIRQQTTIDSLGRFRFKIPVYAPQKISLDWGKLRKPFVVLPGETMMLYLDISEFQPLDDEKNNWFAYWERSKDILFMGENARLHREMIYCPAYLSVRGMDELSQKTDSHMEYLRMAEADYKDYMDTFAKFHRQYPTLSQRCVQVMTADAKYHLGHTLMQNRFNARKKKSFGFDDPAYMDYVNQHFSVDSVLYYFLLSQYKGFVRDYIGYHNDLSYRYVEGIGMCKLKIQNLMGRLQKEQDLLLYDTLITCRPLRELFVASDFAEQIEHDRTPLSFDEMNLLKERVSITEVRMPVLELQEKYEKLVRKDIRYPQSLVNTDHLNAIKDADSLWSAMLAPYRGKVILLDFWGTWCGPCKEMIRRLAPLKHDFKDQEVVFMYFACNSPEESWKNVIREFDLTGKNIVHYNLPPAQQELILKRMKVQSWPTYFLIDRKGNVTLDHIPYRKEVEKFKDAIKRLLIHEK